MKGIKWLLGGLGLVSAGEIGGAVYLFEKTIKRDNRTPGKQMPKGLPTAWAEYIPIIRAESRWLLRQHATKLTVRTNDGLRLSGIWLEAPSESNKLVIALHGYKSKGESDFAALAHFYHDKGYHVLIVDHRAHGKSEGEYVGFGVLDHQDCKKWIAKAIKRLGEDATIYLHGISMGGATALALSGEALPKQIKGIIADCPFTSPWEVFEHVLRTDYHLPSFPTLQIAERLCKKNVGYKFKDIDNVESVKQAKVPILFIHGDKDNFVPTWMSKKMYSECTNRKELLLVGGAGHGESYYKDTEAYQNAVDNFLISCEEAVEMSS